VATVTLRERLGGLKPGTYTRPPGVLVEEY
jgi:hypothetical protein